MHSKSQEHPLNMDNLKIHNPVSHWANQGSQ